MNRFLIIFGIVLVAAGLLWPWLQKLGLGRLPGDIVIERPGFKFYFPLASMILLSAIVSIVLWFFRK